VNDAQNERGINKRKHPFYFEFRKECICYPKKTHINNEREKPSRDKDKRKSEQLQQGLYEVVKNSKQQAGDKQHKPLSGKIYSGYVCDGDIQAKNISDYRSNESKEHVLLRYHVVFSGQGGRRMDATARNREKYDEARSGLGCIAAY